MSTPSASKTRLTGIPTPGKTSAIPTPGRLRSSSSATFHPPPVNPEEDYAAHAFAEAMKAHDPTVHRPSDSIASSTLSPNSTTFAQSGRRSVAGRSPSVASTSSSVGRSRVSDASFTSSVARPPSRASETFGRSVSRAGKTFDVGDPVRIESLGFEGTLRYLGGIDGKPGLWAGVELSGGFAGKGKNDGSVAGKRYFTCPPLCGVFVATTKLSAATVYNGTISRPASVASTRSGRMTPSISGRVTPSSAVPKVNGRVGQKTPSASNGRVTPSFGTGRVTPSFGRATPGAPIAPPRKTPNVTPSANRTRSSTSYLHKTPIKQTTKENNINITPGSRASKYVGMTAKQLNNHTRGTHSGPNSPSRKSISTSSPSRLFGITSPTQNINSPTRGGTSSPFQTPRAPRLVNGTPSKTRASISTPKGRLPSPVAMPPPASPSITGRSSTERHSGDGDVSDLEQNGRALQNKIAELMNGSRDRSSRPGSSASIPPMPGPLPSMAANAQLQNELEVLQARLDAAEDENKRLRVAVESSQSNASSRIETVTDERDKAKARVTELETSVRSSERLLKEREAAIESLERAVGQANADVEKVRGEGEAKFRDTQSKLEDKEALVAQLKQLIDAKEGEQSQNDALLEAKNAEIALLEARVQKAYAELEEERRELGSQVDELRKAGQETIALYEERLSLADNRRYEMEDLVTSLEEQLRVAQARPPSPTSAARYASSAAEIDNETLRIQVQHLQKKISSLEDLLEDARATAEKEEMAVHERLLRSKEREEELRKEVTEGHKEIQRVSKGEDQARARVEEIEEALRENTAALENARAEIEGLRSEIAHLEGIASSGGAGSPPKSAQLMQEVSQLRLQLAEQRSRAGSDASLHPLKEELDHVKADKDAMIAALEKERQTVVDLQYQLEERGAELEAVRKRVNRDMPINGAHENGKTPSSPSKHDLAAAREEIKGLKHIIQELQKENNVILQRGKLLESENKLLSTEIDQLRDEMRTLEENVEQSLLREESMLNEGLSMASDLPSDVAELNQTIRELKLKSETELEQLRKRLSEAEMKSARTVHQLNKEISELETLIETKIYREDELEREVEKLQEKLARSQKKSSKGLPDDGDRRSITKGSTSTLRSVSDSTDSQPQVKGPAFGEEVCEICERPGHDIFSCDLLKDDTPSRTSMDDAELFCEDCEERGHTAAACPHSQDVF